MSIYDSKPRKTYAVGATAQAAFAVPFVFWFASDIRVYVDGVRLTSGYTVTGGNGAGGTVTLAAPVSNASVAIARRLKIERTTDFPAAGALKTPALNRQLDQHTAILQQLDDDNARSLMLPENDDAIGSPLPPLSRRANRVLGFDAAGKPIVSTISIQQLDALTIAALQAGKVAEVIEPFEADGTTSTITTTAPLVAAAQVTLLVGGIVQRPESGAYTVAAAGAGGLITLAEPPPAGVVVGGFVGYAAEVGKVVDDVGIVGGHLIIAYVDGETVDLGQVVGADGTNGRGIASASVNGSGHLILTYTDSTTADVGQVTGAVAWTDITGKPASFPPSSHTHGNADITSLDAAKITSGTIDIARLPAAALERLVNVANQTARYALTAATVQIGDTVREADTGLMYMVVDEAHLGDSAGWQAYTATSASSAPWTGITGKPTTISGYGITDALALTSSAPAALGPTASAGSGTTAAKADHVHQYQKESIVIALGDETTAITTGTAKVTVRMPYAFTLTDVRASLATAGSGATIVNVKENGASIFSTKLQIDSGAKTSVGSAAPRVISDSSLADDAEITLDIDTAGTGAKGLKVTLVGRQAS